MGYPTLPFDNIFLRSTHFTTQSSRTKHPHPKIGVLPMRIPMLRNQGNIPLLSMRLETCTCGTTGNAVFLVENGNGHIICIILRKAFCMY